MTKHPATAHDPAQTPPAPQREDWPTDAPWNRTSRQPSLVASLLAPLSKRQRAKVPFFYLDNAKRKWSFRLRAWPKQAPLAKRIRRRVEIAAISLWWPIGRLLGAFFLWKDGIDLQAAKAASAALAAARHNRNDRQARHSGIDSVGGQTLPPTFAAASLHADPSGDGITKR